jgi:hypothetical protein
MENAKEIFMYSLAALITAGMFILIIFLLLNRPEMRDLISMAIGALVGSFVTVVGYFFGSSKGSQEKDKRINK